MSKQFGWTGKILRVDLTDEKIFELDTSRYQNLIGGVGIAAKIFFDEVSPCVGPYHPENQLAFMTGPLTGTMIPGSGRGELCSRSPLPYSRPTWTYSGFGGSWPAELKFCGYDGVIIEGRAEEPVYLWIHNGEKEIRKAGKLWGLDTFETQKRIAQQVGDDEAISMVIGPAGENLVHMSVVLNETGSAAGYGNMGAVMGSKNLKAVTVRGTGKVEIARTDEFLSLMSSLRRCFGFKSTWEYDNEPFARGEDTYGHTKDTGIDRKFFKHFDSAGSGAAARGNALRNSACIGCYLSCKGYFAYPGLPSGTAHCNQWWYAILRSPEDGGVSIADRDSWWANILTNMLGLNIIEASLIGKWLRDCVEEGIINEDDLPLPRWLGGTNSDREFLTTFLNGIAYRKGFLAKFADGVMKGAESLEQRAFYLFRKHTTARGLKSHHNTPLAYLIWAMDTRDPWNSVHDDNAINYRPENSRYYLGFDASDPCNYDSAVEAAVMLQHSKELKNSLTLCDWAYPLISKDSKNSEYCGRNFPAQLFSVVTGISVDYKGLWKYGERITNVLRAIMVTEGRTDEEDIVDELRFKEEFPLAIRGGEGKKVLLNREKFENAKRRFYELRGWDSRTGRPKAEKLEELGLRDVREKLEKLGLIT
jgi:aldehyde:ferredoxin oxidoreductase